MIDKSHTQCNKLIRGFFFKFPKSLEKAHMCKPEKQRRFIQANVETLRNTDMKLLLKGGEGGGGYTHTHTQ